MGNTWNTVETGKSPSGIATIKVGEKLCKVTFDDGSVDKKFHLDDLPEYPKKVTSGKYFVALNGDKSEIIRIGPANTKAPLTVRCVDFVRPEEGADPEPKEYENKAKHYSYFAFTALLEIQEGQFKKCQIPMFLHYKFTDDGTGTAAFRGNPEKSPRLAQLMEFLDLAGALDDSMEYADNLLPELLARIKNKKREFQIIVKKGYVETLLPLDEYEEDDSDITDLEEEVLDEEELEDDEPVKPAKKSAQVTDEADDDLDDDEDL